MPIDPYLPALRRRLAALDVKMQRTAEVLDGGTLSDKSSGAYGVMLKSDQEESDELRQVISDYEHLTHRLSAPPTAPAPSVKISLTPTAFSIALLTWALITLLILFVLLQ